MRLADELAESRLALPDLLCGGHSITPGCGLCRTDTRRGRATARLCAGARTKGHVWTAGASPRSSHRRPSDERLATCQTMSRAATSRPRNLLLLQVEEVAASPVGPAYASPWTAGFAGEGREVRAEVLAQAPTNVNPCSGDLFEYASARCDRARSLPRGLTSAAALCIRSPRRRVRAARARIASRPPSGPRTCPSAAGGGVYGGPVSARHPQAGNGKRGRTPSTAASRRTPLAHHRLGVGILLGKFTSMARRVGRSR